MRRFKKAVAVLTAVIMILGMLPVNVFAQEAENQYTAQAQGSGFSGQGEGTEENPYQITTAQQLDEVRNDLDAHYVLLNDIDLSSFPNWEPIGNKKWTSIGTQKAAFSGKFDGKNHTISNLNISYTVEEPSESFGLFALNDNYGRLQNINLDNININVRAENQDVWVGGLVGYSWMSGEYIKNCSASGKITVTGCTDYARVGGINGGGDAQNCINKCDISTTGQVNVGGIAGTGSMKNCVNYGNISNALSNIEDNSQARVGGIAGEGGAYHCINYGNIQNEASGKTYYDCSVGGIVGSISAAQYIDTVVNYGDVSGIGHRDSDTNVGGINGRNTSTLGGVGMVYNAINMGKNITSRTEKLEDNHYVTVNGGIARVSVMHSSMKECYSINSTLCNGFKPTNEIGSDQSNGASISETEAERKIASMDLPTGQIEPAEPSGERYRIQVIDGDTGLPVEGVKIAMSVGDVTTDSNGMAEFEMGVSKMVNLTKSGYKSVLKTDMDLKQGSLTVVKLYKENSQTEPENPGSDTPSDPESYFGLNIVKDTLSFANFSASEDNKECYTYSDYGQELLEKVPDSANQAAIRAFCDHTKGHCYGYSYLTAMNYAKRLDYDILKQYNSLNIIPGNDNIKSLVCSFQMQNSTTLYHELKQRFTDSHTKKTFGVNTGYDNESALKQLIASTEKIKKGGQLIPVSVENTGNGFSHSVLAYDIENGNFSAKNQPSVSYDTCIKLYDTNSCVTKNGKIVEDGFGNAKYQPNDSSRYLYINTKTYEWEIPHYVDLYKLGSDSKDAKITFIQDTLDLLDPLNFRSSAKTQSLNDSGFKQIITVERDANPFTIVKIKTGEKWNVTPKTYTVNGASDLMMYLNDSGQGNSSFNIVLPDNTSDYQIVSDQKVDLTLHSPDTFIGIDAKSDHFNLNGDGSVSTGKLDPDYSISYTSNDSKNAKLPTFDITGNDQTSLNIKPTQNGIDLTGSKSSQMTVEASNYQGKTDSKTVRGSDDSLSLNTDKSSLTVDDSSEPNTPVTPDQPSAPTNPETTEAVPVYRVYHEGHKEHLYTTDSNEVRVLTTTAGWKSESVGWNSPSTGTGVYRLYSPVTRYHLYTTDMNEVNVLSTQKGWQVDNKSQPLFYSGGSTPIYRLYHEGQRVHHLTKDGNEYNVLGTQGWNKEGVKFYALSDNEVNAPSQPTTPTQPDTPSKPETSTPTDPNKVNLKIIFYQQQLVDFDRNDPRWRVIQGSVRLEGEQDVYTFKTDDNGEFFIENASLGRYGVVSSGGKIAGTGKSNGASTSTSTIVKKDSPNYDEATNTYTLWISCLP